MSDLVSEASGLSAPRTPASTQSRASSPAPSNASGKSIRKSYLQDASDARAKALKSLEQVSTTMKEMVQKSADPQAQFGSFVVASLNQLPDRYQRTAQLQIKKILADFATKAVSFQ